MIYRILIIVQVLLLSGLHALWNNLHHIILPYKYYWLGHTTQSHMYGPDESAQWRARKWRFCNLCYELFIGIHWWVLAANIAQSSCNKICSIVMDLCSALHPLIEWFRYGIFHQQFALCCHHGPADNIPQVMCHWQSLYRYRKWYLPARHRHWEGFFRDWGKLIYLDLCYNTCFHEFWITFMLYRVYFCFRNFKQNILIHHRYLFTLITVLVVL